MTNVGRRAWTEIFKKFPCEAPLLSLCPSSTLAENRLRFSCLKQTKYIVVDVIVCCCCFMSALQRSNLEMANRGIDIAILWSKDVITRSQSRPVIGCTRYFILSCLYLFPPKVTSQSRLVLIGHRHSIFGYVLY